MDGHCLASAEAVRSIGLPIVSRCRLTTGLLPSPHTTTTTTLVIIVTIPRRRWTRSMELSGTWTLAMALGLKLARRRSWVLPTTRRRVSGGVIVGRPPVIVWRWSYRRTWTSLHRLWGLAPVPAISARAWRGSSWRITIVPQRGTRLWLSRALIRILTRRTGSRIEIRTCVPQRC